MCIEQWMSDSSSILIGVVRHFKVKCILLKNDGNPISLQERAYKETTYPKNGKHACQSN